MELARCDFLNLASARSVFCEDYAEARRAFLAAIDGAGLTVDSRAHPKRGPHGEALACDVVWIGPRAARRVLVLMAGTHGVEGFCGSAILTDWVMGGGADRLPDGVAVLLIHAINPHGFAWLRRVTEDGVDLNRNFIDFSEPLPADEGYGDLAEALIAEAQTSPDRQALQQYQLQHGRMGLENAITSGQYSHPDGLFYGGKAPTWSRRTLESVSADYGLADRSGLCVIDLHTGLGPYGYGELICDHPPASKPVSYARQWFGDSVTEPLCGTSTSGPKRGLTDYFWHQLVEDRGCMLTLEFGTYPFDEILTALCADHWLHAQGGIDWSAPHARAIKTRLRHAFYPAQADWQEMVLFRGRQVVRHALAGLASLVSW